MMFYPPVNQIYIRPHIHVVIIGATKWLRSRLDQDCIWILPNLGVFCLQKLCPTPLFSAVCGPIWQTFWWTFDLGSGQTCIKFQPNRSTETRSLMQFPICEVVRCVKFSRFGHDYNLQIQGLFPFPVCIVDSRFVEVELL